MSFQCPYCGATSELELLETNLYRCRVCGNIFNYEAAQIPQENFSAGAPQLLKTLKISKGKILTEKECEDIVFLNKNFDKETEQGLESVSTRAYTISGGGLLIRGDEELLGKCRCGALIHAKENYQCSACNTKHLLCGRCVRFFKDKPMCLQGFIKTLLAEGASFPLRISFKTSKEIIKILFLKKNSNE